METPSDKPKRTRLKLLEWFSFLFTILAVILFATAVFLNRSYHRTSLKTVSGDFMEELHEASLALESGIRLREESLLKQDPKSIGSFLRNDEISIFSIIDPYHIEQPNRGLQMVPFFLNHINTSIYSNNYAEALSSLNAPFTETALIPPGPDTRIVQVPSRIVPSFLAARFKPTTAHPDSLSDLIKNLEKYRESGGRHGVARKFISRAAKISPITPEGRISAIWSNLHIAEFAEKPETEILYYLLYLLFERSDNYITSDVRDSLEERLTGIYPDFEKHKKRSSSIWSMARMLTSRLDGNPPPVRMMVDGKIVTSVRHGHLISYRLNWLQYLPRTPYIQLSVKNSIEKRSSVHLPLDFMPGYRFWISRETFDQQSLAINRQYLVVNTLLGLLLLLIVLFIVGTVRMIREENDLAHLRSRFVATVSHELRTPLSLIQLYSETLFENRIDSKKKNDYLQTIVAETQRLTGLVNNVIDFSRLENRVRIISYSDSNLSELSWNVIREFKYRLNMDGFRLNVNIHPDVKARVDPQAFCRVLFNLLDNAIKYSEKERYLAVTLEQTENSAVLKVTDHGIGIPVDAKPFVYLDYYRVDDRRVASQRGSGIGLSVVKQLLDSMHAKINMSDAKPCGTTFTVDIPRDTEKDMET